MWDERRPDDHVEFPKGSLPQPTGAPSGGTPLPQPMDARTDPQRAAMEQRNVFQPPNEVQRSAISQMGEPPPPMEWNPIKTDPRTGHPSVSPTAVGDRTEIAIRKRDALDKWRPEGHRGVGQVLKDVALATAQGIRENPNNPWAAVGAAGAGVGGAFAAPREITRSVELNRANQDVERSLGESRVQSQIEGTKSQQEAREAAIRAGEERVRQGDDRNKLSREKFEAGQRKPIYTKDAQGRAIKIIPQGEGQPDKVEVVSNVTKTKVPHTEWIDGKLKIWNPETGHYDAATDTNGNELSDQIRTPVQVEIAGKTFTVSPNTAAMATATGERFSITEARAERQEGRQETQYSQKRQADAAGRIAIYNNAKLNAANPDLSPEVRKQWENFAVSKRKEIENADGDMVEFDPTGNANMRPASAPAPTASPRTGPKKAGSIQAKEDPAVRAYANQYYGGSYQKAYEAIQAQRQKK